jgi:NitT/TauT family transport system ATP-binding protein
MASGSATPIQVRGVRKRFRAKRGVVEAVAEMDLEVGVGEFVSLVGPSGCGKSTLLGIVAGLLPPSYGEVLIEGRRVTGPRPDVGIMFQDPVLLAWRTARANVLLPIEVRGGRQEVRALRERADELLELVGLSGFENRYPSELSGGMQQRVAICRMLIADPDVLLLDEPFGALDEITREYLNVELSRICARTNAAVLFVTHNIQEAVFISDRVVVMTARPGRVAGSVDVDLPRPRALDVVTTEPFQRRVRRVRELLNLGADGARDLPTAQEAVGP